MRAQEQATVWGTHIEVGRTGGNAGCYQQLKEWRATRKAARRQARLAAINACWDAQHETL